MDLNSIIFLIFFQKGSDQIFKNSLLREEFEK